MFDATRIPDCLFDAITDIRVKAPHVIAEEAAARARRPELAPDGHLCVLACDHPARLVTSALGDPLAMGDRRDYLSRVLRVLSHDEIDGVMSTPDIIDDLLIVSALQRRATGRSFLDGKVLMGCMNRGGLAGAVFEMDDMMTAYDAQSIADSGLDCAKLMFRLDVTNPDSLKAIKYCADALTDLSRRGIPAFLEPLPVERTGSGYRVTKTASALIQVIGVASALGVSSALTWLKVPIVPDFPKVCRSTTLPMLLLGGRPETIQQAHDRFPRRPGRWLERSRRSSAGMSSTLETQILSASRWACAGWCGSVSVGRPAMVNSFADWGVGLLASTGVVERSRL